MSWRYPQQTCRLVRQGPAKRKKNSKSINPDVDPNNSDQWEPGGIEFMSDMGETDAELSQFLQSNTSFILTMAKTAGFTALA